jgi:hypothetical protein
MLFDSLYYYLNKMKQLNKQYSFLGGKISIINIIIGGLIFFIGITIPYNGRSQAFSTQSSDVITYDSTRTVSFPFDKSFNLSVGHLDTNTIKNDISRNRKEAYLFRLHIKKGVPVSEQKDLGYALTLFYNNGNTLLAIPPLKPDKSFNILIKRKLTEGNLSMLLELNEVVYRPKANPRDNKRKLQLLTTLNDKLSYLRYGKSYTGFGYKTTAIYKAMFDTMYRTLYDSIYDKTKYGSIDTISIAEIRYAAKICKELKLSQYFILKLQSIIASPTAILLGTKSISQDVLESELPSWNVPKRVSNLSNSIVLLDSAQNILNNLFVLTGSGEIFTLLAELGRIQKQIRSNYSFLKDEWNSIKQLIDEDELIAELNFINGPIANAVDLQTLSGRILTSDIGLTNIFTKDNQDKSVYIPRPFLGFEIFFRQVDRGVRTDRLPPKDSIPKEFRNIIAYRSILQRLTLSIGLTLGAMTNPDLDNFYNNMSLQIGPSYRFAHILRFSAGIALIQRLNPNPVLSSKHIIGSVYASFSADIDFLTPIAQVTSKIFK